MVAPGSLGKYKPGQPTKGEFYALITIILMYSLVGGFLAGSQPNGAGWRLFSWHPFLMMVGMIGLMGAGAMIKKLGGYTNTKLHGIFTWSGLFCAFGGLYAIYHNKEMNGYKHWQTTHAMMGIACIVSCVSLGFVGGFVLHPDFGIAKTNKNIRMAHKFGARIVLLLTWFTAFMGLQTLNNSPPALAIFAVPLMVIAPLVLM
mmetsp:Transcript_7519/g.12532  ORF Transcript_7519/g.12532 Transcript_7519/m.12532 type:complete len:202 (-) Transcript_7519:179-784(-)|eukprot:CAMPEP_0119013922 /NCGR_PEP_ID=MMETSP1176-20130426/9244_1 /TAXON_ID=265551 /ORGANISM="Synedropsis recta cf, Strain CCMP1620" /LENGTH=201 /DNA_ID=CAMNT_0006967051 /DNA_START=82 /DNA_END=687 /DNA_ORIENTATION=-